MTRLPHAGTAPPPARVNRRFIHAGGGKRFTRAGGGFTRAGQGVTACGYRERAQGSRVRGRGYRVRPLAGELVFSFPLIARVGSWFFFARVGLLGVLL